MTDNDSHSLSQSLSLGWGRGGAQIWLIVHGIYLSNKTLYMWNICFLAFEQLHLVAYCHSSTNFPSTSALINSYSWSVLSGMPMVAFHTRQLPGRPKLLYLQRTASPWIIHDVPSAGVGDAGAGKRFWLASSWSGKNSRGGAGAKKKRYKIYL